MNRKIEKYLSEISKTEKKIKELQAYLKGLRAALRAEEDREMIRSIRSRKLPGSELYELLDGIQDGSVRFLRQEGIKPGKEEPEGAQSQGKGGKKE